MNIIGIDFSLNSPALCILKEKSYSWVSLSRIDRSESSLLKNQKKPFYILSQMDNVRLEFLNKEEISGEYSERERIKMKYFDDLANRIYQIINESMKGSDFFVAMEGLSFSSSGNSLIDISMATMLLRKKIIDLVGIENFFVYSPTTIKKFAIKGNAKKHELYEALINFKDDETNIRDFTKILETNKKEWVTPAKAINKPIDDIVDATWINLYLKNELEKLNGNKGNFEEQLHGSL